MLKLNSKLTQFLTALLKVGLLILIGYVVYKRLAANDSLSWQVFLGQLDKAKLFSLETLIPLLSFSVANWLLEIKKWQMLSSRVQNISFFEATKQALASQATTLITPMRAGEYGIKALYVVPKKRKKIISLNLFGNLSQLVVTLLFGCFGGLALVKILRPDWFWSAIICGFLLIGAVLFMLKLNWFSSQSFFKVFSAESNNFKLKIFSLAFLRYVVFSHQFYVLLLLFNIELGYVTTMAVITATYLLSSIVPVLSFFDIVVKGGLAVLLFGLFGVEAAPILCATTLMWLFNLVLPSIFGSVFLLSPKLSLQQGQLPKTALQDA